MYICGGTGRKPQADSLHIKQPIVVTNTALYLTALSKVPNVGPITGRQLISYCGSPEAVFQSKKSLLTKIPQVGYAIAANLENSSIVQEAEAEFELTYKAGGRIVTYLDDEYPQRLKFFEESPLVLYLKGDPNLNPTRTVGIIGTRHPTPQSRYLTESIISALQDYDVTIVSGMAHGIDSYAHLEALHHDVPTIGILGHGFHTMYPAAHRTLASKMTGKHGLITEFGYHTKPDRENFPMRNRVIAAFSDALVVVESKEKGGSMITAEFANRYNKDVFAVPGKPSDATSRGCNLLIKSNKAHLLEAVTDLTAVMRWEAASDSRPRVISPDLFPELSSEGKALIALLQQVQEASIDDIGYQLNMRPSTLSALLMDLEFKGVVKPLPGKRFTLAPAVAGVA